MNFFENAIVFDKFQIKEKMGEGPVFSSYLGKNTETGGPVLIRFLNPSKYTHYEVDKICFGNELPAIKAFDNTDIVHLYEAGSYSNTICVVTDYYDWPSLEQFLMEHSILNINTALKIILQLASSLRYAHSKNILHRNINSSNIRINESGGEYDVKLCDFGLFYIIDYGTTESESVDTFFGFMAPESTGLLDRKVDARADLYSLGILLYRLLTGNYPFHADTLDNMVYQHVAVMPKDPTKFNPTIPDAVSKLIMKLLAKDPDQRYQTANELINDIDLFMCANLSDSHILDKDLLQTIDQRARLLSRKHELAQLRNHYTKALEGPGRFCLVKGSWGSGKSDLFANLCTELSSSNIPYYRAQFSAQASLTPYYAFHNLLNKFCEDFDKYDRRLQITERNRLARSLSGLCELVFKISPAMRSVLPDSLSLPTLEGYREHRRSVMLLSNFFLSLYSQGKPFVIILDDVHNADAASLSLLCEMADHIKDYKLFIVCSCREDNLPESNYLNNFLEKFSKEELFSEISLVPFDEERMCEYLSDLLILDKGECQVLSSFVLERTSGNPYYAVNVLRSMLEDGVISVNNGVLEQNWNQLRSFNRLQDVFELIKHRMDKLDAETIEILEIASVIGESFSADLLCLVTGLSASKVSAILSGAVLSQFVEYSSTGNVLEFSHDDIHAAFYDRIEEPRRKDLHYRIAKAIELLPSTCPDIKPVPVEDTAEIYRLVYHLKASGNTTELRKYIMAAAALSKLTGANDEALTYYSEALELMAANSETNSEEYNICKYALVDLNLAVGDFDAAIAHAHDLMSILSDKVECATLMHKIALGYYRQSNYNECEALLFTALNYLDIRFETNPYLQKLHTASLNLYRMISAQRIAEEPSAVIDKEVDMRVPKAVVAILETLCWVYAYSNIESFKYVALKLYLYAYRHFGVSKELAVALSSLSIYYMLTNQPQLSEEAQNLSLKLKSEFNDYYGIAHSHFFNGLCMQWRDNVDKSIKNFKDAQEIFTNIGDLWELNNTNNYLATSYLMAGDYSSCEKLCESCIENSIRLNDTFALVLSYANLISCYLEMGDFFNAEEVAKRTLPIVEELNFPYASAVFYNAYGRLLLEIQKYQDAVEIFTKTQNLIENKQLGPNYMPSVYSYLAIVKIKILDRDKLSLSLSELQARESEIAFLCDKAYYYAKGRPSRMIIACRANALYGMLTERFKKSDSAYLLASDCILKSGYHYINARLTYDYGHYLLSKHKTNDARFYIFEAYMTFANISSQHYLKACEKIIAEKYQESFKNSSLLTDFAARRNRMNVDRKVNTLLRLGDRLTSTLELEELQRKILQDAVELVGAERGILFLYPETGEKKLYVASLYNLGNFDCNTYDWMLDEVEKNRKPIVINDVQSDEYRKHYSIMVRYGIKSVMAMPMFVRGNLFGVIYLDSRLVRQIFTDDYIEAMTFIANQGGAPIENARLYHRAITDGLTGIYGRSYLDNLIADRTSDPNAQLAAIMIDVDNFKRCNDTYGHPFGDKVLKQIAGIMKRVAGDRGIPCRYGGEEFVLLLDSNDIEFVHEIAARLRQTAENSTLACNNGSGVSLVSVTISLGVSIWDNTMERVDLIEHADKALYYAKTHGKNQVVVWSPEISED